MTTIRATRRPQPTYLDDKQPCRRCGVPTTKPTPKRKATGYCRDCQPYIRQMR